ncbi:hypothetical protein GCM10011346_05540 [Oceanobacillus neutriphilus]|uniref:PTS EIIA type-4 domain-containing protein n=2 Tax=Oceanobacillus neutriphilus TaxID=531815 RepID=A0ABQ2NRI0_9BACI|nr:hypothetical protein GCM10011346_05540 [Oceanobacillus neutriphilus]
MTLGIQGFFVSISILFSFLDVLSVIVGVLLFYDIDSAKMNAEIEIEMSKSNGKLIDGSLVESSYIAAVEAGVGKIYRKFMMQ